MPDRPEDHESSITWQRTETAKSDSTSLNPYAPSAFVAPAEEGTDAELVRRRYLSHEVSVQSIGNLYLFGSAVIMLIFGLSLSFSFYEQRIDLEELLVSAGFTAIAAFQLWVGIGLRRLEPWSRRAAILWSTLGLLAVPIGTVVGPYFLYLLRSRKGAMVFSEQYAEIRAATPHIDYRTPVWLWGLLILFIAGMVLLVTLILAPSTFLVFLLGLNT